MKRVIQLTKPRTVEEQQTDDKHPRTLPFFTAKSPGTRSRTTSTPTIAATSPVTSPVTTKSPKTPAMEMFEKSRMKDMKAKVLVEFMESTEITRVRGMTI